MSDTSANVQNTFFYLYVLFMTIRDYLRSHLLFTTISDYSDFLRLLQFSLLLFTTFYDFTIYIVPEIQNEM